nr:hypothetical protein [Streptomyces sp. N502]
MLGSPGEAESAVDEAYRRWYGLSEAVRGRIASPRSWLARTAGEICLRRLAQPDRSATGQREGLSAQSGDAQEARARLEEEVSRVLLNALDSLSPDERAPVPETTLPEALYRLVLSQMFSHSRRS